MRSLGQRAVMLMLTIFLMGIFLVMGMGFLQQRVAQNRAATASIEEVQARAMARAGIEDALAKLSKNHDFPPMWDLSQEEYSYTEVVENTIGDAVGSFTVSIDTRYCAGQYWLIRITSSGSVGDPVTPLAQSTLHTELDVSKIQRPLGGGWSPPQLPNPHFFQLFFIKQGDAL